MENPMVRNRGPWWRCILRPFCIRATTKVHVPWRSSGSSSSSYSCSRYWGLVQNVSAKHKERLTVSKYHMTASLNRPFEGIAMIRSKQKVSGPTWEIPATASRVASNPATLVDRHSPTVSLITLQSVRRQVTHLQLGEVALEVFKRHPESESEWKHSLANGLWWLESLEGLVNN